jgi:hypothetical protein
MSKRDTTLLSERQIRQFMKLAELAPLADGFVEGLSEEKDPDWGEGEHEYKRKTVGGVKKKAGDVKGHDKDYEEDIDESHGRGRKEGAAGYGKPDQNSRLEEVEADPEALEDYALGDEERGEFGEAEEDELEADDELGLEDEPLEDELGPDRNVSIDDFLAALEVALEEVLGDEVEVEQEEAEEEELDLAPDEEEIELGDIGVEEEEELELQEMVNRITKRVAKRIVKEALKKK